MFQLNLETQKRDEGLENQVFDLVIIGAGPAGLTAAIYAARDGWNTLLLEKESPGGLAATTHSIENYPGFPEGVEGSELMDKFSAQAKKFGAQIVEFEEVERLTRTAGGSFEIHTEENRTIQGRAVLVAAGSEPKRLGIPGEEEFYNQGVSYCATCDGPLYKGRDVVVIGCGNSGLQEAQILLQYARSVTFVEYLDHSIAEQVLQDRVQSDAKSTCLLSHTARRIQGNGKVSALQVEDRETGQVRSIGADAVFIYIGYSPSTEFLGDDVDLDEQGYIITDQEMRTSVPGLFAAGDVRADNLAQVSSAVGEGARAAVAAREYLQEQVRAAG